MGAPNFLKTLDFYIYVYMYYIPYELIPVALQHKPSPNQSHRPFSFHWRDSINKALSAEPLRDPLKAYMLTLKHSVDRA